MSQAGGDRDGVSPELLLRAYAAGFFPMAESRHDDRLFWVEPERRGIIPLDDGFHTPRRLAKTVRAERYRVTTDEDFGAVMRLCAEVAGDREDTWINAEILDLYSRLHMLGCAHSVETRGPDGAIVGGLYGVRIGGAFFGESMVSRARDASKIALVHLVARLKLGGFALLDAQFYTPHLGQFGAIEIDRAQYRARLDAAVQSPGDWFSAPSSLSGEAVMQAIGHTS